MEPKTVDHDTWDDLVFENRNKAYGAYALRKSYNNQVLLGFGLSVALVAILLFLPKGAKPEIIPTPVLPTIILDPAPDIIPNIKPEIKPLPPARRTEEVNTNTTPIITTDPVDTTAPETSTQSTALGSTEGSETGIGESQVSGTGDAVVATIEVPKEVVFAEVMPQYDGMYDFIKRKLHYPSSARRMGIEGTVYVSFLVQGDGSVTDVKVLRGIHHDCDKEAVKVVSQMTGWSGGRQGGRPVTVRMVLPIKFKLNS